MDSLMGGARHGVIPPQPVPGVIGTPTSGYVQVVGLPGIPDRVTTLDRIAIAEFIIEHYSEGKEHDAALAYLASFLEPEEPADDPYCDNPPGRPVAGGAP